MLSIVEGWDYVKWGVVTEKRPAAGGFVTIYGMREWECGRMGGR